MLSNALKHLIIKSVQPSILVFFFGNNYNYPAAYLTLNSFKKRSFCNNACLTLFSNKNNVKHESYNLWIDSTLSFLFLFQLNKKIIIIFLILLLELMQASLSRNLRAPNIQIDYRNLALTFLIPLFPFNLILLFI